MNNIAVAFTSRTGWLSIAAGVVSLLTWVYPVLPNPWAGLVAAILAVAAFYHVGKAVTAGRVNGVAKGL